MFDALQAAMELFQNSRRRNLASELYWKEAPAIGSIWRVRNRFGWALYGSWSRSLFWQNCDKNDARDTLRSLTFSGKHRGWGHEKKYTWSGEQLCERDRRHFGARTYGHAGVFYGNQPDCIWPRNNGSKLEILHEFPPTSSAPYTRSTLNASMRKIERLSG